MIDFSKLSTIDIMPPSVKTLLYEARLTTVLSDYHHFRQYGLSIIKGGVYIRYNRSNIFNKTVPKLSDHILSKNLLSDYEEECSARRFTLCNYTHGG